MVSTEYSTKQYTCVIASTVAFRFSLVNNNDSSYLATFTSLC